MNKLGVVALIIIVAVASIVAAFALIQHPEDVKIDILGNGTIKEGGSLNIKLSDLKDNPVSGKKIKAVFFDKNGKLALNKSVTTSSNGKAKIDLNNVSAGKYTVYLTFNGDDKYSNSSTTHPIVIKKKEVVATPEVTQQTTQSTSEPSTDASDYDDQPSDADFGVYTDEETGERYYYEDRGGYYNINDDYGNGISVDYDGNVIGTYDLNNPTY